MSWKRNKWFRGRHVTPRREVVVKAEFCAYLENIVRVGDEGVDGVRGNAAVVLLVARHLNVASVAPGGRPRVFDEEILFAIFFAITNGQDTVVEVGGRAGGLVVDTLLVELKRHI